jgi:ribosome-associated protein
MNLETRKRVADAVRAIESKKAEDVAILEMDRASGAFTDCFILCSGTNPRQIQAIADEVEHRLALSGRRPHSLEGYNQAEWVLLDYVDFVVHVFSERARRFYDLERLWKSARRVGPSDLAKRPKSGKAHARAGRTKPSAAGAKVVRRGKSKPAKGPRRRRKRA